MPEGTPPEAVALATLSLDKGLVKNPEAEGKGPRVTLHPDILPNLTKNVRLAGRGSGWLEFRLTSPKGVSLEGKAEFANTDGLRFSELGLDFTKMLPGSSGSDENTKQQYVESLKAIRDGRTKFDAEFANLGRDLRSGMKYHSKVRV